MDRRRGGQADTLRDDRFTGLQVKRLQVDSWTGFKVFRFVGFQIFIFCKVYTVRLLVLMNLLEEDMCY